MGNDNVEHHRATLQAGYAKITAVKCVLNSSKNLSIPCLETLKGHIHPYKFDLIIERKVDSLITALPITP